MSTTHVTPAQQLGHSLHHDVEEIVAGALEELDAYCAEPTPMRLTDAANLLDEAAQKVRALRTLAH